MSLTITIDGTEYKSNNIFWNRNLDEWLNDASFKQQLITGINIVITSTNSNFTGPKLSNFFNGLPTLPLCIKLNCRNNELTTLPPLPLCTTLYCSSNRLTALPALPVCTILDCKKNQFAALPALPLCTYLDCDNNQLTALPALPACTYLYCNDNKLNALPSLPLCIKLNCRNNQLSALPALPRCGHLECYNNELTTLPALPNCIILNCSDNELTTLPALPNCTTLNCSYNQLNILPALLRCQVLDCNGNPNLIYTQAFAARFNLPFPSPKMVIMAQSAKDRAAFAVAIAKPKTKGTLTSNDVNVPTIPRHRVKGNENQSNIQSFLGGNIPLKYTINYTSKESSHYPYLLNL